MSKSYWYKQCPRCRQGRLFIIEDVTHHRLYLHCEECEMGYKRPEDADIPGGGFLTLDEDFKTTVANLARIVALGWEAIAQHCLEE